MSEGLETQQLGEKVEVIGCFFFFSLPLFLCLFDIPVRKAVKDIYLLLFTYKGTLGAGNG